MRSNSDDCKNKKNMSEANFQRAYERCEALSRMISKLKNSIQ